MRLIDAAVKDLEMIGDCRTCGNKTPFCDNLDSCKGYKWRGAPPGSAAEENPPLTLEELREMDGEPVWVIQPNEILPPFWGIVNAEDESVSNSKYCANFEDYDTEWLAYRRRPEDGTK